MKLPFLKPVVPPHVFCVLSDGITYANVRRDPPAGFAQSRHFAYPPNTLGSGSSGTPLFTREAIAEAVESGRRLSEGRLSRASVVFPDAWARMLPIEFDSIPDTEPAVRDMVLWKLKKLLPGVTSELTVVFREMTAVGEGKRLLVAAAPADTLISIENSFESAGVRVGTLAPASLLLFEGFTRRLSTLAKGDFALVHRSIGSLVFLVIRDGSPLFFRQRASEHEKTDQEQELRLSLSYYTEKLGGQGLTAVYAHDETPAEGPLSERFHVPVESLSGRLLGGDAAFDERIGARPELLSAFAAASAV
jgi:hypothetical protein